MNPLAMLLALLGSFALLACIAAVYVFVAWRMARRMGERSLLGTWILGSVFLAVLYVLIWSLRREALGVTPSVAYRVKEFGAFFGVSALAFGLATLSVRRRLRRSNDSLKTRGILAGVGAFFGGLGLVFLAVLLSDLFRFF
ncbi:MAG: hypothetical protein JSV41_06320 [Gemmatimonadota bacterium]|nr:MAG: hypothetical protein JSV41_06320 [Gemmatimonadota bacterium]